MKRLVSNSLMRPLVVPVIATRIAQDTCSLP
jgi:hypothetical protein